MAEVQAEPELPPPVQEKEDTDPAEYAKKLAKAILSHTILGIAVTAYVVGGAFLFIWIESDQENEKVLMAQNRSIAIENERQEAAAALWAHKWDADHYNETVETIVEEYHANITQAINEHRYSGLPMTDEDVESAKGWTFASSLLFTVSVVTTIGYGHIAPATEVGQLILIVYALVGLPLMLMFLANIGDAMAKFFRIAYGKGCCYCCNRRRAKEYEVGQREYKGKMNELHNRPKSAWSNDYKDGDEVLDAEGLRKRKGSNGDTAPGGMTDDLAGPQQIVEIPPEQLDPPDENINVPISLTLVVIAAYVMIGAVLFAAWNDWTWITGAYFSFVTLSTIGFGDLVPGWSGVGNSAGNIKLAVSSLYIILGLAVLSMSFNLMMEEMIQKFKWLGKKLGIVDDDEVAAAAGTSPADNTVDDAAALVTATTAT